MKGTLHKTENGWQVWYHAKDDLYHGSIRVRILPLHPDAYSVNGPMKDVVTPWEGQEVEFEIVDYSQKCKECGETVERGRSCRKGCFMKPGNFVDTDKLEYAKLVDQKHTTMKGGEGWDKILDKAIQDKAEAFTDGHYHYRGKDAFIEGYKQGLEDKATRPLTEDDAWITIKGGDITVNFKPMPEFDEPKYPDYPTRAEQLREQAWDTIWKDFRANKNASYSWALLEYLRDNYNPPTKKQDND